MTVDGATGPLHPASSLILPLGGLRHHAVIGRRLGKGAHWVPVGAVFIAWLIAMAAALRP